MGRVIWILFSVTLISCSVQCKREFKSVETFAKGLVKFAQRLNPVNSNDSTQGYQTIYTYLEKLGYPYEIHHVTTEDGYILGVQRITAGQNKTPDPTKLKPAIILQHGLLSNAFDFINAGPGQGLALRLADAGWDVWLGNARGNLHSRNHTTLDPDIDVEFWDFSFHEAGCNDIPALINYIQNTTKLKQVAYVGHSQGTSQFFAMGASRPDYNDKISLMIALAPVAYMTNFSSPLLKFAALYLLDLLDGLFGMLNWNELLPYNPSFQNVSGPLCEESDLAPLCPFALFFVCGFNYRQFRSDVMSLITIGDPAGISRKMLIHYAQEISSGTFRLYDYGLSKNLDLYKTPSPPVYNTSAISAPAVLYYSRNDLLAAAVDVERLASEMPNAELVLMSDKFFNHIDYIWSKDINSLLNDDILDRLSTVFNKTEIIVDSDTGSGNAVHSQTFIHLICMFILYIFVK